MKFIVLLTLIGLLAPADGQIRILEERISDNQNRIDDLVNNVGFSPTPFPEVPYIDSGVQWIVPLLPSVELEVTFELEMNTAASPHYAISAIEMRNNVTEGACGVGPGRLGRITQLELNIGYMDFNISSYVEVSSYLVSGEDTLDLVLLGLDSDNDLIRFNFPAIPGDAVFFEVC